MRPSVLPACQPQRRLRNIGRVNKKIGRTDKKTRRPAGHRPGRRSLAETAQVRARILDEAEHLFASKGYRGVSFRELGRAVGVRPFTITHHFGSKLGLYSAVLGRWDGEVRGLVMGTLGATAPEGAAALIERIVEELFEFFLARRDWVSLSARAVLGEGLPPGAEFEDRSWVRFMNDVTRSGPLAAAAGLDLRLLLITVEGILNNLVLSGSRYRQLFGRDLDDPRLRAQVKSHLNLVLLRLLPGAEAALPASAARAKPRPRRTR
jgi:AcrR family transcriptional regulator